MARFYADMYSKTVKAPHTIVGHKDGGITAHVRGWNTGVRIYCHAGEEKDAPDIIEIYQTGGSHNPADMKLLATIKE